jgi:fatty acid desaturase
VDGFVARRDLIPSDRLGALNRRSDARGLRRAGAHLAVLLVSGVLVSASLGTPWALPAFIVHGVVLIFLFAPLHETIHRTAFASRMLNDVFAWFAGMVLVLPPGYFRLFHFAHHRFTQDPKRDPELATPKPATIRALILHVSGLPYWKSAFATTWAHARGRVTEGFITPGDRPMIAREARWLIASYGAVALIAIAAGSWLPLTHWIVPAILGQPALRFFLLAEHTGCAVVPDMLRNTRTTRSNPLVRWLAWNMPYHAEHHLFFAVPFHALPEVHALVRDRLAVLASGYATVHRDLWSAVAGRARAAHAG